MAYFPPYIDDTGLHIPLYTDVRDNLIEQAKAIFGQDIYLEIDSQDYQYISAIASSIYDAFLLAQLVYNNRSPVSAIGAGLDGIVKINGIKRLQATYSTAVATLIGIAGTQIKNGVVKDINGIKWNLPSDVVIGVNGTLDVTLTCQVPGLIAAQIGEINIIDTPTYGWTSISNTTIAKVGNDVESNSKLRARQAISAAQPSRSILEGLKGAIASLTGVSRSKFYENKTKVTDSYGLPGNSITCIIENGDDNDIAKKIFLKKSPGVNTNGTTTVNVIDNYNDATPISFYRPSYVDIDVVINIKALSNYTSQITDAIINNVVDYLNQVGIGTSLTVSMLWGIALSANSNLMQPNFSITSLTAAKHGDTQGTSDIAILFNEVVRGAAANISVVVS